jgi:hypothetical protein
MAKLANQEKKPEDTTGDFPHAHKVNYIFGGPDLYVPKRKQNLIAQEILEVGPATPKCSPRGSKNS